MELASLRNKNLILKNNLIIANKFFDICSSNIICLDNESLFQLYQGKVHQNVMDKELKGELDLAIQSSTIITNPLNYYGDVIKFTKEYIARRGVGVEIVNDKVTDFLIQQELVKITHPEVGAKFWPDQQEMTLQDIAKRLL